MKCAITINCRRSLSSSGRSLSARSPHLAANPSNPAKMSFTKADVQAIVAAEGVDNLTAKTVRLKLEAKLGLEDGALKSQKEEISKMIDEVLERLSAAGANVNATDGARVNTEDGWWLLRASNTQDVLVGVTVMTSTIGARSGSSRFSPCPSGRTLEKSIW